MLALTMSTTLVATPIEDARPTAATYPVLSGLSYATCAAELSRQIDTYRKDMVVAAQRSDATALALEAVRGGPWQQQRLDTAAADLREKTRRLVHCWDANLQVLEELLRPFDVQSQETNSVACESVPAALPITTPPPLGLVLESRPKIAVADMVLYGVRGGQNNVTSDRSRNRDVAHPVYSHYSQVLFHVTLDWSTVGAMARHSIHAPLLRLIDAVYGAHETSKTGLSVLLPGCGAGRLVYELASRGFRVEAADSSVAAVAAAHSILFRLRPSLGSVESPGLSRSIYPYVIGDGRAEWDDEIRFAASPLFGDLEDADSPHVRRLDTKLREQPRQISLRLAEFVQVYSSVRFQHCFDAVVTVVSARRLC